MHKTGVVGPNPQEQQGLKGFALYVKISLWLMECRINIAPVVLKIWGGGEIPTPAHLYVIPTACTEQ